jgi:hypothetical protein
LYFRQHKRWKESAEIMHFWILIFGVANKAKCNKKNEIHDDEGRGLYAPRLKPRASDVSELVFQSHCTRLIKEI